MSAKRDPRVALVTGAARGLGLAMCERFYEQGLRVVIADLDANEAQRQAERLDATARSVIGLGVDVTSSDGVDGMTAAAESAFGGIDILVNNAGTIDPSPSHAVSDEAWSALIDVHLTGTFRCCRSAYPLLARSSEEPAIVNVASIAAHFGISGRSSYGAAKAGIEGLTRVLAIEWARVGIRVNAVAPGYIKTGLAQVAIAKGLLDEEALVARTPLGRMGDPNDIAAVVAFLASPEAAYVTGQTLLVDGGHTINGDLAGTSRSLEASLEPHGTRPRV